MPNDGFKLPTGEIVRRIYGVRHPGKGTAYLNAVRTTKIDENSLMATEYHGMKRTYAVQLAAEVKRHVPDFDAVISPPSSRPDAEPYRDAVLYGSKARDISQNFCKRRLFPILLRGLSTVEDLQFSALLRQIERSRGNGTIERNARGERRCRQACKTHSFREPGMA
jgi:hypothetical protein